MNLQTILDKIAAVQRDGDQSLRRVLVLEDRIQELERQMAEQQQKRGPGRPPKEVTNVG